MNSALAVTSEMVEDQQLLVLASEVAYVTETPVGLTFRDDTPMEVWAPLVMRLVRQHKKIEWAIADAINFGGKRYGETYAQWVDETGLSENSLANIAWVGRQVESSRRREDVDFGYYREVAALDPEVQERLIDLAVDNGMKRYELREAIKAEKAAIDLKPSGASSQPAPTCSADLEWAPSKDDLLPEHQAALHGAALDADLDDPTGFVMGALWMARYTASEALFADGKWRD